MMYRHLILVESCYTLGTRIGFHLVSQENEETDTIKEKLDKLLQKRQMGVGMHSFSLDSAEWKSVVAFDSFFEDIKVFQDFDDFEEALLLDTKITALDVAKFFASYRPLSHLKLQQLVYLAYQQYLIKYKKSLFDEKIIVFQSNPLVEEVYQQFKKHDDKILEMNDRTKYTLTDIKFHHVMWRLDLVDDAENIKALLLEIIEQYEDLTEQQLMILTRINSMVIDDMQITNDIILEQKQHEVLAKG